MADFFGTLEQWLCQHPPTLAVGCQNVYMIIQAMQLVMAISYFHHSHVSFWLAMCVKAFISKKFNLVEEHPLDSESSSPPTFSCLLLREVSILWHLLGPTSMWEYGHQRDEMRVFHFPKGRCRWLPKAMKTFMPPQLKNLGKSYLGWLWVVQGQPPPL